MQGQVFHDAGTTAKQQVVTFAWYGIMEIKITGTCLAEQMFPDDTAQFHCFRILVEQLHQLFATHPQHATGHHRLYR